MNNQVLVIITKTPYSNTQAQDGFDFAMAAAAFDMPIKILLQDQGILNLTQNQNSKIINRDSFIDFIKAAELYELDPIYIVKNHLEKYNLTLDNLIINKNLIQIIDNNNLSDFIDSFEHVIQY